MKSNIKDQFQAYYERISIGRGNHGGRYYRFNSLDELKSIQDLNILTIEQVIAKSILDLESQNPEFESKMRPDAKVLLIKNYSEMVYYPLSRSGEADRPTLKKDIYEEVQIIVKESAVGVQEISAHKILETGLKHWNLSKLMNQESWGF
jgi:hypothetical protein